MRRFNGIQLVAMTVMLVYAILFTASLAKAQPPPSNVVGHSIVINHNLTTGTTLKRDSFEKWIYDVPPSTLPQRWTAYAACTFSKRDSKIYSVYDAPKILRL